MLTATLYRMMLRRQRRPSSGKLAEQEELWRRGLISDTHGQVFHMEQVERMWAKDYDQFDALPLEIRRRINNMEIK